jgi:LmbE family N-acetylglucosaminyl deacetylase
MRHRQPVYLSPHLDDAALSCGGLIHQQVREAVRPLVITFCARSPDYQLLSSFAAEQHHAWGQPEDPVGDRRREDVAAMAALGADYQHWDYLDCIYRRHPLSGQFLYTSNADIFGPLCDADLGLIDEMTAHLMATVPVEGTDLYAPLAVGHHVDHQVVLQAALRLRQHGWTVLCYEDLPYAEHSDNLAQALQPWSSRPTGRVEALDEKDIRSKIAAIGLYRTQMDMLFGGHAAMARRIRAYASAAASGSGYGERYWLGGAR